MRIKDTASLATRLEDHVYRKHIVHGADCLILIRVMPKSHVATLLANGWELVDAIADAPFGGTSLFTKYTLRKRLTAAA